MEGIQSSQFVDSESTRPEVGGGASLQARSSVAFGHRGPAERLSGTEHSRATMTKRAKRGFTRGIG